MMKRKTKLTKDEEARLGTYEVYLLLYNEKYYYITMRKVTPHTTVGDRGWFILVRDSLYRLGKKRHNKLLGNKDTFTIKKKTNIITIEHGIKTKSEAMKLKKLYIHTPNEIGVPESFVNLNIHFSKKIHCVEDNLTFNTIEEACEHYKMSYNDIDRSMGYKSRIHHKTFKRVNK